MASKVFFTPALDGGGLPAGAIGRLFEAAKLGGCFKPRALVALKLHFGEPGNRDVWRAEQVREVVHCVKAGNGVPFVTDANVMYRSMRHNAVEHLMVAHGNGFSYESCGAPLIIADGLHGDSAVELEVPGGKRLKNIKIAAEIARADAVISLTHVTGHVQFGLGAALKNLGMGSGSAAGKQMMHEVFRPEIDKGKCVGCGECAKHCPVDAITVPPRGKAKADFDVCVGCGECLTHCPVGAIPVQWGDGEPLQERTVESCAAIMNGRPERFGFISLLTGITGQCDCVRSRGRKLCRDIGALASLDPVAIDQATLDLLRREPGAAEHLEEDCPATDPGRAQEFAEGMGLGSRRYELKEVRL